MKYCLIYYQNITFECTSNNNNNIYEKRLFLSGAVKLAKLQSSVNQNMRLGIIRNTQDESHTSKFHSFS